ncbi:MAG: hypothetical protein HND47_12110 [Chloroflexi bacterium]|nr:hypothetical protein [Chloroflexota bacterium]
MKKSLLPILALILAACGSAPPALTPSPPTSTPTLPPTTTKTPTQTPTETPTPKPVVETVSEGSFWAEAGVPVVDLNNQPLNIEVVKIGNEYFALRFGYQIKIGTQNPDGTIATEDILKYDLAYTPEDAINHPWPEDLVLQGVPGWRALLQAPENPETVRGNIIKSTYTNQSGSVNFLEFKPKPNGKSKGIAGFFTTENGIDGGMVVFWQNINPDGQTGEIAPLTYFSPYFAEIPYPRRNPWVDPATTLPTFGSNACVNGSTACEVTNDPKTIELINTWVDDAQQNVPLELTHTAMTNPSFDLSE